ncbi:MAG: acetate kinase [Buchnera aphidicola (Periphyllus lyropictus)]|uniref:acetate kinase n=1 Tax=Buchnera aphidicola TaxID=9 RepID=UPI001EB9735B|nr:acetate kinase [Buchnera aphidicola]NIH16672.1 acetate kinase [Buchnera aphidicola (Periphyllus lyropictus)]USS94579.1 acetate kinase [Buchnera aphidicola (Periphyllus lyropictus)]
MLKKLILVLNCGSSSLKFSIIDPILKKTFVFGCVECLFLINPIVNINVNSKNYKKILPNYSDHHNALNFVLNFIKKNFHNYYSKIYGIGHRVVHGGENLNKSSIINHNIIKKIKKASIFAPLHNPSNLIGIQISYKFFPHLKFKNVAVFDTSFHSSLPKSSYLYAIPYKFYKKYKIRRYGAHGISHNYIVKKSQKILKKNKSSLNLISCHLGNGSSITAIRNGKSIDTSMGLTPLEGLVMGTRSGDLDPAIIFFMYKKLGIKLDDIEEILTKKSGLLGLTEKSSDCRYSEKNYKNNKKAKLSIDIFCHRLAKYISAYSSLMKGRLDALIFTGGIGENSSLIRKSVVSKLELIGFFIDKKLNISIKKNKNYFINKKNSRNILVIPTKEELFIAIETKKLIY